MSAASLALFSIPGGWEWILIVLIALVIFGRRLPDVARSVGKSIVEFKKGIKDVKNDIDDQSRMSPPAEPKLEGKPEPPGESTSPSEPAKESSTTSS